MWQSLEETISPKITKYKIQKEDEILNFRSFISELKNTAEFRQFFNELLQNSPFEGFFWETPPITNKQLDQAFEFVLVQSDTLVTINSNPFAFQTHLKKNAAVLVFPNLRGDAQLVVPNEKNEIENYAHLANFVRYAPVNQIDELWKAVGIAYEASLGKAARWLSTHGLGVSWLHIRIDSRPKYYHYKPYKNS